MTNFEKIKNKTIDEVAKQIFVYENKLCDKICLSKGECKFDVPKETDCINCIKEWLATEVD